MIPTCPECNSPDILFDASVAWDEAEKGFSIIYINEKGERCNNCGNENFHAEWIEET